MNHHFCVTLVARIKQLEDRVEQLERGPKTNHDLIAECSIANLRKDVIKLEQAVKMFQQVDDTNTERWIELTRDIMEQARAIVELQKFAHYYPGHKHRVELLHPIQLPAETDKCKTCNGTGKEPLPQFKDIIGLYEDKPKPDPNLTIKVRYCLCGARLNIHSDMGRWWYACPSYSFKSSPGISHLEIYRNSSSGVSHFAMRGSLPSMQLLETELEKLPQ